MSSNFRYNAILVAIKLLNVILITIPFSICWELFYRGQLALRDSRVENMLLTCVFFIIYFAFGKVYDAFLISYNRIQEMIYSQCLALVVSHSVLYFMTMLLMLKVPKVWPVFICFLVQACISFVWCVLSHRAYYAIVEPRPTAIIYDNREGMEKLINKYNLSKKYDVQLVISIEECLANIDVLADIQVVFLSDPHSHDRNIILKYCMYHDIDTLMIPRIGDLIMASAHRMHMFHLPILRVKRYNPSPLFVVTKRLFDIVSAGIVLLIISPFMLLTALAIKMHDGGPVFYKQKRLTKDGEIFNVLKFRSMRVDAEKDGVARLSTGENDDRITPVGHIIRKVRIDELPQLLNIIGGSMSVVGPRPERPEIAAQYEKDMPEFALRLQAKAGLTGYAQVYGKYNTTPYDKLQMDLMYIANPSFFEDLMIIFATIKILFLPESTEGVAVGQVTAGK